MGFSFKKSNLKRFLAAGLSAALLLATAACGSSTDQASSSSSASGAASDEAVVNIGTMNLVNGDLIAQYEKYYEKELGVKVNIINFKSGKDVNTALAAGSVDITELGSAPTALGLSNGLDYKVFWVGDVIGKAESLAVKNDSGINSVADLKGKKIGTPFSSTAHYSLLQALKLAGLSESDVTILDLQPNDIYAAWQRGDIDAAYVWYPVLDQLLADGKVITDSQQLADKNVLTGDLNVVRSEFAQKHPDVVKKYVQAQIKANDIILNDPDKAAQEVASVLEIDSKDAAKQLTGYKYLTADEQIDYLANKIPEALKSTADFLVSQNSIKEAASLDVLKSKVTDEFVKAAVADK